MPGVMLWNFLSRSETYPLLDLTNHHPFCHILRYVHERLCMDVSLRSIREGGFLGTSLLGIDSYLIANHAQRKTPCWTFGFRKWKQNLLNFHFHSASQLYTRY